VAATRLAPRQRGLRQQAREQKRRGAQPLKPGRVPHQPGMQPHRATRILGRFLAHRYRSALPPAPDGILERSQRGAAAEYQALEQRVRSEPVGAVYTRAGALAGRVQPWNLGAPLSLMSEAAATQPVLCVVDDAQWLDPETTRALAFVARRLGADSVGLVFATRKVVEELGGVPELHLDGLSAADSRTILDSVLVGHLDGMVRERLLAETHGNPLALIELPRALTPAEAATGIVRQSRDSLSTRIEDSLRRQLELLPDETRRLLLLAAAEPLGDPLLLVDAAAQLGLSVESADAAEEAGLFQVRERCSFRHPLVRSAVCGAATPAERRAAHGAIAEATDPQLDPDRRAWHRAQATPAPDEDVAMEPRRALGLRSLPLVGPSSDDRGEYDGEWELPVLGGVAPPAAVLVRPDGYVASVGDGTDIGLRDALTTWFGPR
jgi:hypothetical protein